MRGIDLLAPLGVVLALVRFLLSQNRPEWISRLPGPDWAWYAGFAALILLHLILRRQAILDTIGRRQVKYGTNALVSALAVLGILVGLNYLAFRHSKRWDLTKNQRFSLSDQTKKVLAGLDEDVKLLYFEQKNALQGAQDRMKELAAASEHLQIEYVDPRAKPVLARQHQVTMVPSLVFLRGDRTEKIGSDSEQEVVNALIKVTRAGKKTVCFAEGEGERDYDDGGERGLSALRTALTRGQYEASKLSLLATGKVPDTCAVVVVAGPQKDLLPPAIDALRTYVAGGGKLLLLVEPELEDPTPNVVALAREWNVELGADIVVDISPVGQYFGTGELMPLASSYPPHEITREFRVASAFPTVRTAKAGSASIDGVSAQDIVQTGPESWAETDLAQTRKGSVQLDPSSDRPGPVSLAVAVTITPPAPPTPEAEPSPSPSPAADEPARPEGRVVVYGDVDWLSDSFLGFQGNRDLALNTIAWLSEDADLISIRPKEPDDQRLFLTANQQFNVQFMALILLPGLFIVLGIASWWRRRS